MGSDYMFSEMFVGSFIRPPVSLLKKKAQAPPLTPDTYPLGCPPSQDAIITFVSRCSSFRIYLKDLKMPAETPGGDDDWYDWHPGQGDNPT